VALRFIARIAELIAAQPHC